MTSAGMLAVACTLSGSASTPARASLTVCREVPIKHGDESRVIQVCRGADGKWKEVTDSVADKRNGPVSETVATSVGESDQDTPAEVEYRGTFSETMSYPSDQGVDVGNGRTEQIEGAYKITAQLNGAASTATFSGTGLETISTTGTAIGGFCRFFGQTAFGTTTKFEGRCSKDGFSGTISGRSTFGVELKGSFETTPVRYVDVAERESQAAIETAERERKIKLASAEAEREASARASFIASRPNASSAVASLLERTVEKDSTAWLSNIYNKGSMHNVKIIEHSPELIVRGDYTYNRDMRGWVEAKIVTGKIVSLHYFDKEYWQEPRLPENEEIAQQNARSSPTSSLSCVKLEYSYTTRDTRSRSEYEARDGVTRYGPDIVTRGYSYDRFVNRCGKTVNTPTKKCRFEFTPITVFNNPRIEEFSFVGGTLKPNESDENNEIKSKILETGRPKI